MSTEHNQVFDTGGQCCCPACAAAAAAADALKVPADANAAATSNNNAAAASSGSNPYYIDALVNEYHFQWGSSTPGTGVTITYSFLDHAPNYYAPSAAESASFAPMTAAQEDAVRSVLQMYSAVANVHFVEVSGVGSITFGTANLGAGVAGWTYYPYPGYSGPSDNTAFGDVWITNRYAGYDNPTIGNATFTTLVHEIGHALGLKHPGNYDATGGGAAGPYLPSAQDSQQYSVMSYHGGSNGGATPTTPQLYDIAALQYLYGANTTTHAGNDTYTFATTTEVKTIWDAGGTDTFDASNQPNAVRIDLHAGSFSSIAGTENVAIAFGTVIETAFGSGYNDSLMASDAGATLHGGAGNDTLVGGAGVDILHGNDGNDVLFGGAGADQFVIDRPGDGSDYLADFTAGQDRIVLDHTGFGTHAGTLGGAGVNFVIGAAATSAGPAIVFNGVTGDILWDSDGIGGAAPTTIAHIDPGAASTHWGGSVDLGKFDSAWQVAGSGDFNNDGNTDILWRDPATGQINEWQMTNGQWAASKDLGTHGPDWQVAGIADFNADATNDILWRNPTTGQVETWMLSGGQWQRSQSLGSHGADWQVAGVGDFNGDGTSDVLWRNPSTGQMDQWSIRDGNWAGSVTFGPHGTDWVVAGTGDFNNDGTTDVLWRNPTTGQMDEWKLSNGQWAGSVALETVDPTWKVGGIGDFNSDGTSDVLWRDTKTGAMNLWAMQNGQSAATIAIGTYDTAWDVAGTGDLNNDGNADVLWHNNVTGQTADWLLVTHHALTLTANDFLFT